MAFSFHLKHIVAVISAGLAFLLVACGAETAPIEPTPTFDAFDIDSPIPDSIIAEANSENTLLSAVYARVAPSVVAVEARLTNGTIRRGSGFIHDRNGRIVTGAQVVVGAEAIFVTFSDGLAVNATPLGADSYSDVAVLAVDIPASRSVPVIYADSDAVNVGERAIVLGNPYGLSSSMTTGIIGGIGRQLPSAALIDFSLPAGFQNPRIIQLSVAIPPGGSGGPVLNSHGEVIALGVEVASSGGLYQGVGFGVPSNTVTRVIPDLIRDGEVAYAWLGVNTVQSAYGLASFAPIFNLPTDSGVLVTNITLDSPADEAGLRGGLREEVALGLTVCTGGDIITAIDGTFISHMDDLVYHLLVNHIPGDTVTLLVLRDGTPIDVSVTLGQRPTAGVNIAPCGMDADGALPITATPPPDDADDDATGITES